MKIGLVDADYENRKRIAVGKDKKKPYCFPNLALMKYSAWHKAQGDTVEWYKDFEPYDIVYVSKVFSDEYTPDYPIFDYNIGKVIRGGSGYAIHVENGQEVYDKEKDPPLPQEVEHIFPDYSIYEGMDIHDTAVGFITRGCPRGCHFCHVAGMQGRKTYTSGNLHEFWNGQKHIVLLDPNLTASKDYDRIMDALAETGASVDFSQGLDVRLLTPEKIEKLNHVKWERIHFAWDRPDEDLRDKFLMVKEHLKRCTKSRVSAYILTNYDSTHEQDMERVNFLREIRISPYVMIYRKDTAPDITKRLQRFTNWPSYCFGYKDFDDFQEHQYKTVLKG